jgi:uncharacterized protein YjdB
MPVFLTFSFRRALQPRRLTVSSTVTALSFALLTACAGGADVTGAGSPPGGNTGGTTPPPQNGVPSRVEFSTNALSLGAIGASGTVSVVVRDAGGVVLTSANVAWSSADITIADVSGTGTTATVSARAPGRTVIRATSGSVTQELSVSVNVVRGITLPGTSQVRAGSSVVLTPTVDADSGAATGLRWESANPTIASVANGVVTGIQPGSTVIRVSAVGDPRITAITQLTVTAPRSVVISKPPSELFLGEEAQFNAMVDVNDGESRALEWSTSNPTVASMTQDGKLIAVGLGTVTVRVRSIAFTGVQDSTVVAVRVPRSVTVAPGATTLSPGQTRQMSATVQADESVSKVVLWRSANPSVAMISSGGLVTGVAQGTTTITAVLAADTTRRGTASITIIALVRDVAVQPSAATVTTGETRQLTASVTADPGADRTIQWRSANSAVASVSNTGLVTGVSAGTAVITAVSTADTTKQSTSTITVRSIPVVTVSPTSLTLSPTEVGTLIAAVQVDAGVNTGVTWRTNNSAVATVNGNGQVTALANGSAIITAVSVVDTVRRASASITVRTLPTVRSVSVTPNSSVLQVGQTVQLVPNVVVSGGAGTGVTFRSDNPAVASVNFTGGVTGLSSGTANITVTSSVDATKSATATVTVSAPPSQLATAWSSTRLGGALYEDAVSIDATSATNAFAVNSRGDLYIFNGSAWTLSATGSSFTTRFLAVSASSATTAMAVGTNGAIVRFDGTSWSRMSSGTQQTLNGIHVENASTAFAVGAGGLVLRFNGSSWAATPSGSGQTLYGVWTSGTSGFAVGSGGEILRWNGSTWARVTSGTTETLYGVNAISASNAVAVGAFGTIVRWNGTSWSRVNGGNLTADLYNVAGSTANSNRYYIASDNGLYSLTNTSVALVSTPYAPRLFGAAIDASGNVWTSGQRGSVMRLSGTSWETVSMAPDLIDVWTTSATNAWAVGEFGFVYRWNGSAWARQSTPTTGTLNAVWGASASEGFAGGEDGVMLRFNGSTWSSMSIPSSGSVYGIWGSAGNNVFAVTSNGEVLRFNGSSWSVSTTSASPLWAVYGTSANDVYATGESGVALRFNGTSWSSVNASTSGTLAGVWGSSATNLMAVGSTVSGSTGIAFRNTGSGWTSMAMPTSAMLTSIWGPSANDVYATGDGGLIVRWNGSSWSTMSSGTSDQLWSVSGAPTGTGGAFAVGYNSTVAAGTSSSGMVIAGFRALTITSAMDLDPRADAETVRGALPSGKERRNRKH